MTVRKIPTLDSGNLIFDKFMPTRLASGAVAPLVASVVPDANLPARLGATALATTIGQVAVPRWVTATNYTAGDKVVSPNGDIVSSIATHTSGASFTPANWNLSASYAPAAGSTNYAPGGKLALGTQIGYFGDSITNVGEGYPFYVSVFSKQQLQTAVVASNPGYTSASLLAVQSQILGLAVLPQVVVNLFGTNDAQGNLTVASFAANAQTIYNAQKAAGIQPVVCTIPPLTGGSRVLALQINLWLRRYAMANRLPLIDFYGLLVDQATGIYKTAFDSDGIHPSNAGIAAMANEVIRVLGPLIPAAPSFVGLSERGINLQSNSNLIADTNADGIADRWAGSGAGATFSLVADSAGFKWQRITLASAGATRQVAGSAIAITGSTSTLAATAAVGATTLSTVGSIANGFYKVSAAGGAKEWVQVTAVTGTGPYTATLLYPTTIAHNAGDTVDAPFAVGDTLAVSAKVRSGQSGTTTKHTLQFTGWQTGQSVVTANRILTTPNSGMSQAIADGVVYTEYVVPALTAVVGFQMNVGPGDGTYDMAQPTIVNLTALGLA